MNQMTLNEAMQQTVTIDLGIEARCVKRRDKRGRLWYLIVVRDKMLLVRQDRSGVAEVTHDFAAKWTDWVPQNADDAAREAAILNTPGGRRFRNTVLGLVLGPLPENGFEAPDHLPADL